MAAERSQTQGAFMQTTLFALLQNMRPKQWAKNGFVFAGILFDQQLTKAEPLARVMITFGLLCLTASTIYIINDLVDIEKDKLHPKKKNRPLPSGRLPIPVAQAAAAVFMAISVGLSLLFSPQLTVVLVTYLVLHIGYSFILKNVVILDVFAIAGGFILRVIAGIVVIEVQNFSPWLYVCAGLLSLFLAVGKRRQELILMGENAEKTRPIFQQYNMELLNDMLRLVLASTAVGYTLYATEAETILGRSDLYVIHVKKEGGDPTEVLFEDRPLQIDMTAYIVLVFLLLYIA
jgi:4-hydroxybenzoate polyprenyltransferase